MWQRFSGLARKVVFYAQEEAQTFSQRFVDPEHLLLGILREPECSGTKIILAFGISAHRLQAELEKQLEHGQVTSSGDMTLTPSAKRVIDLAYDEARKLGHNYIGTEHLLLGIIRNDDGLASRVLVKLGLDLELARATFLNISSDEGSPQVSTPAPSRNPSDVPHATRVLQLYLLKKERFHADQICLMFLSESETHASLAVAGCGSDARAIMILIEQELLSKKNPHQLAGEVLGFSEFVALASAEAKCLGQELNGSHFLLAALVHGSFATSRALVSTGVTFEKLQAWIVEHP